MVRKRSHSKISMDVVRRVAYKAIWVCLLGTFVSILIPQLGILSFNADNLVLYLIIAGVLAVVIILREVLCENKTFMSWAGDNFKKAADAVLFVSIALIILLPFILGVVNIHGSLGWVVPLAFLTAFIVALGIAVSGEPNQDNP